MKRIAFAVLVSASLAGCGQMGPLYFKADPPADQLPPSRKNPPATIAPLPVEEHDAGKKSTP